MRCEFLPSTAGNPALKRLFLTCFDDTEQAVDFFLDYWSGVADCAVAVEREQICAALYLLPCSLWLDGQILPAHYLYAAGTAPSERGRGVMRQLLQFAGEAAASKGDAVSTLLPANDSLSDYYQDSGYRRYFFVRQTLVKRRSLELLVREDFRSLPRSGRVMQKIRNQVLTKQCGAALLWDERGLEYASRVNDMYGGKTVVCQAGYALFRTRGARAEVLEWICEPDQEGLLLCHLLRATDAEEFLFRLPPQSTFLYGRGEQIPFGMAKSLDSRLILRVDPSKKPYLGIALD